MSMVQVICTLLQTDNHANTSSFNFLQAGCSSCCPYNSIKAVNELITESLNCFLEIFCQVFSVHCSETKARPGPPKSFSNGVHLPFLSHQSIEGIHENIHSYHVIYNFKNSLLHKPSCELEVKTPQLLLLATHLLSPYPVLP